MEKVLYRVDVNQKINTKTAKLIKLSFFHIKIITFHRMVLRVRKHAWISFELIEYYCHMGVFYYNVYNDGNVDSKIQ